MVADPSMADEPPVRLHDFQGREVALYAWNGISCPTSWDEECDDRLSVPVPKGYEYCTHAVVVHGMNNGSFQVDTVDRKHVEVSIYSGGSGMFFDRWGGDIDIELVVGAVKQGEYSLQRCAPRRSWATQCSGRGVGACYNGSACADLDAIEIIKNDHCRRNEGSIPRPTYGTPNPCQGPACR
jgi:hypothetical protein